MLLRQHPPNIFDNMSLLDDDIESICDIKMYKHIMQKRMIVSRVIHPIGQGAFYTERIRTNGKTFNIVYDCGGTTSYKVNRNKPILEAEIKTFYGKNENIDLLFISHFDYDHVNGLKYLKDHCNIKRVIMPLIPTAARWIYLSQLDDDLQLLMTNPGEFFGNDTEIISVRYSNGGEFQQDELVLNDNEPSPKQEIVSGTIIQFRNLHDWCYIPFNFDEDARYKKLIDLMASRRLELDKLLNGDVDYIIANRAKINEAYKNVVKKNGSSNESSLIVYSGPVSDKHEYIKKYNYICNVSCLVRRFRYGCNMIPFIRKRVACLYLGDTDLNQVSGGYGIIEDIYHNLGVVKDNIGTIQVPHHGSEKSFNDDILWYNKPSLYFASFGNQNRYGHPSYRVVEDIEIHNHFVGVTEDRNSALVETIISR